MQAHKTRWCLLWCFFLIACTHRPHMLSLISRHKIFDPWQQKGSDETTKKSRPVIECGHVTLKCVQMASKQGKFSIDFTMSQSCRSWHPQIPWSHSSNQLGRNYCQALIFLLRTKYILEMWCVNTKLTNQSPLTLWKPLSSECLWVIVAFNGNITSMLSELATNRLNQWLAIKEMWISAIFANILKLWLSNKHENSRITKLQISNSCI